jgi:hypothetical protein
MVEEGITKNVHPSSTRHDTNNPPSRALRLLSLGGSQRTSPEHERHPRISTNTLVNQVKKSARHKSSLPLSHRTRTSDQKSKKMREPLLPKEQPGVGDTGKL